MQKILPFLLLLLISACKTKQNILPTPIEVPTKGNDIEKIISSHYAINRNFSTAFINAKINYKDEKQTQGVSANIRIKKNELILISIQMLGITLAKGIISPTQVKYYEKINGKYFEGDYATLSKWLGTPLDFEKVQNILLGLPVEDLKKGKFELIHEKETILFNEINTSNTNRSYAFDSQFLYLLQQIIAQQTPSRTLLVNYSNYQLFSDYVLPTQIKAEALDKTQKTYIEINYTNAKFNEELTFPYQVPDGYEQITINE